MKFPRWTSSFLIIGMLTIGSTLAFPPLADAGDKGIIFGRLNNKVMGDSWNGEGKLVVVIGDNEKKKKDFKMCKDGYVAGEVDAGKVKLDVVENKKEKDKEKREAFLNQPVITVAKDQATYWGDVKVGFDYGSLTFRTEDKEAEAKAALKACLAVLGEEDVAAKLETAVVEKQFAFEGMTDR